MDAVPILIVDDDAEITAILARLLAVSGYVPYIAASLEEARIYLRDRNFMVHLVDYMLPDGDGSQLFADVRSQNPAGRLILMSGRVDLISAMSAMKLGFDAMVLKPLDLELVMVEVERVMQTAVRWKTVLHRLRVLKHDSNTAA
ncbi:MAG: response regulator [Deltaproteobacteria bacterium]|nr:response regulator [Deltaproteobacteria bacterium]